MQQRRFDGSGCLMVVGGLVILMGLAAIASGIGQLQEGAVPDFGILLAVGSVLVLAGTGLSVLVHRGRREARSVRDLQARHPGQPWMWNSQWAARRLEADDRVVPLALGFFAVVWNLLAIPTGIAGLTDRESFPPPQGWLMQIFPAIGAALAAWAVVAWLKWRKYGRSVLELQTLPAWAGEDFQARLVPSTPIHPPGGFQVRLACVHRVTTGSGKSTRTDETTLWMTAGVFPDDGRAVPIRFGLAADIPPTEQRTPRDEVVWRLAVEAEMPGLDYGAKFAVPVFRRDVQA